MGKSPWHWIQGPGLGLEIMGGTSISLWPEAHWIAWTMFALGTVMVVWPVVGYVWQLVARKYIIEDKVVKKDPANDPKNRSRKEPVISRIDRKTDEEVGEDYFNNLQR